VKSITFTGWLMQAFELANRKPVLWLGGVILLGLLLCLGRISLALNIVVAVSSLFVGVGLVASIDQGESFKPYQLLREHLPTALLLAVVLTLCWFGFRVIANFNNGEPEKVLQFFFHWELTHDNLQGKVFRELIVWLYSSAIVTLIFVFLMLSSFGSWFSYPLMVFEHCGWSEARERGNHAFRAHSAAMYKLSAFLLVGGLIGLGLIPLLTPLFYMLISTLMYVSYRDIFVEQ
jgi:hypothetical protein